ncbi:MAG TPA: methanol dehydrogenase [Ruminococcaceae bacterium]|nr:methanol dehydrogenase [Oscillospiraceae bacterium]
MSKKIISVLFAIVLCFCMIIPAFAVEDVTDGIESATSGIGFADEYSRVLDYAGVLPQEEDDKLVEKFDEVANRQKIDMIICFTNGLDGMSTDEYAKDLYLKNNYGYGENKDGVMLLVSFEDRDWYILTKGYAKQAITESGIQYIGNQIKDDLANKNYYAAGEYFAQLCDELITDAKNGNAYNENFGALDDENTGSVTPPPMWILISIGVGIVIALIVVGIMKGKLKTVRMQASANNYLKDGSLNITESQDIFLYSSVSKTEKPKNDDNNSSNDSSDDSFGGGGGKF